jgi:hypothetical protein
MYYKAFYHKECEVKAIHKQVYTTKHIMQCHKLLFCGS